MAKLDDIVTEVRDGVLRKKLQDAIADMKRKQRFGLVFEEHIPETTALLGLPIQTGATVQRRDDPSGRCLYLVKDVNLGNGGGTRRLSRLAAAQSSASLPRTCWSSSASAIRFIRR